MDRTDNVHNEMPHLCGTHTEGAAARLRGRVGNSTPFER